jgi:phage terminase large subunit
MDEAYRKQLPVVVHCGSSRSSKTYNILLWIIVKCMSEWQDKIIDIGRKTFPSLRTTAMFDFFTILRKYEMYDEALHNKTENTYMIRNNTIRFFSVDQEQKVRGSKRDFLFLNEANEFSEDDFKQLNMRTTTMTILDYNPSAMYHWIYDNVLTRDDVVEYRTTFRDNPFLEERIVKEIESYQFKDPNYWRVFGLGLRGVSLTTIFPNWTYADSYLQEGQEFFGLDFGFNDPTAMVRVKVAGDVICVDELLYKKSMTSDDIVLELEKLVDKGVLRKAQRIYADSARPELIQAIVRAGFNCKAVEKGKDSILRDINFLKLKKIQVTKTSVNAIKEIKNYMWRTDRDGKVLDEPVDVLNHCLDGLRYSLNELTTAKVHPDAVVGKARLFR